MFESKQKVHRYIARRDGPDPVDVHVGKRLREARKLAGMSQETLAIPLGCTYQAVQKYERGVNRISASVLYKAARALDQSVLFFFEELK